MAKEKKPSSTSSKHKYFDDQFDNEEVLFVFRKHPVVMRKGLIYGMAAWLIGPIFVMILTFTNPDKATLTLFGLSLVASVVIGMVIFMPSYISWYFSVYIVTDQRLIQITQKGLFNRSVVDMGLNQIQMVNYEIAGLQETLLGFGTIMMQTFVGDLIIHDVHHPAQIQKQLIGILRDQGVLANQYATSSGQAGQSGQTIDDNEED